MPKPKYKVDKKDPSKQDANIVPLHKRKAKEKMMNKAGFYDGMPGCTLDEFGNRKMIDFIVKPDGYHTSRIYADPRFLKLAIQGACETNPEIKAIVQGAIFDNIFKAKGILNWLIRQGLYKRRKRAYKLMLKKEKEDKVNGKIQNDTEA